MCTVLSLAEDLNSAPQALELEMLSATQRWGMRAMGEGEGEGEGRRCDERQEEVVGKWQMGELEAVWSLGATGA